jgi:hypothetical protein
MPTPIIARRDLRQRLGGRGDGGPDDDARLKTFRNRYGRAPTRRPHQFRLRLAARAAPLDRLMRRLSNAPLTPERAAAAHGFVAKGRGRLSAGQYCDPATKTVRRRLCGSDDGGWRKAER